MNFIKINNILVCSDNIIRLGQEENPAVWPQNYLRVTSICYQT